MSTDGNWDVEKYREDHECEEHWSLRKAFIEKWRQDYPEDRLICLARVFANMEFMGCRYPAEVMHEVSRLSQGIVQSYRNSRKNKLKRTFVAASTAAEDRAKGVKRLGGVVQDTPPQKSAKISFVRPGDQSASAESDGGSDKEELSQRTLSNSQIANKKPHEKDPYEYFNDLSQVKCIDVRRFRDNMFHTTFGRMVLLIRPWANKIWNIQTSCNICRVKLEQTYQNGCYSLIINGKLVAQATGETKNDAKNIVEAMAWNRLKEEVISVVVKELWIAHGDARISVNDVSGRAKDSFGTPIESSVATKMMKLMGWKGGALGADAQGIAEPIQPKMQMVNRAGLGSSSADIRALRTAAMKLMQRYMASDTLDLDLVFSSEFSKDERAALHQVAQHAGLASKSYGDVDRFLVVKKKLDPFSLTCAVIEKGGETPKYRVFIPAGLETERNGR